MRQTLSGFTSPCRNPDWWIAASASAVWRTIQIASLGTQPVTAAAADTSPLDAFGQMLEATWNVVGNIGKPPVLANALAAKVRAVAPIPAFPGHVVELYAPDFEHVADTMAEPILMQNFYVELYEPEGWLDKSTEIGPLVSQMGIISPADMIPSYDRFVPDAPLLVSAR